MLHIWKSHIQGDMQKNLFLLQKPEFVEKTKSALLQQIRLLNMKNIHDKIK